MVYAAQGKGRLKLEGRGSVVMRYEQREGGRREEAKGGGRREKGRRERVMSARCEEQYQPTVRKGKKTWCCTVIGNIRRRLREQESQDRRDNGIHYSWSKKKEVK